MWTSMLLFLLLCIASVSLPLLGQLNQTGRCSWVVFVCAESVCVLSWKQQALTSHRGLICMTLGWSTKSSVCMYLIAELQSFVGHSCWLIMLLCLFFVCYMFFFYKPSKLFHLICVSSTTYFKILSFSPVSFSLYVFIRTISSSVCP